MSIVKKYLFLCALALLALPGFQSLSRLFPEHRLFGYEAIHSRPDIRFFTWQRWFNTGFQREYTACVNDHTGFRNEMIVGLNQFDYSLFRQSNAPGFIIGKNDVMFEEDYCHEYTGRYFIGEDAWNLKLDRLREVSDSLSAHGTALIVVVEPGKAGFFPEYIPDRFHPGQRRMSNYDYLIERTRLIGLPLLDLQRYFLLMKDTASFPLFPDYGMHWSLFGAYRAMDTLARCIIRRAGARLPEMIAERLDSSDVPRGTDHDIECMLNLMCKLPSRIYGYPSVRFDSSVVKKTLAVLVIADSYYVNLADDYGNNLFGKQEYWYYNNKLYPYHNETPPVFADKRDLKNRYLSFDMILLMISEVNLHNGFWNFADEAWLAFHPEFTEDEAYQVENEIRNNRPWFRSMVAKAARLQRPLPEIIRKDAAWVVQNQ